MYLRFTHFFVTRAWQNLVFFVLLHLCYFKGFFFMRYLLPVAMLVISNIFMTLAWYGHLKLQDMKILSSNTPLYVVILLSWGLALAEYAFQVPANRIGFEGNGGVYSLMQLKVIQEVITLVVFVVFSMCCFRSEAFHWNHLAAALCLVAAVYFVFMK